MDLSLGIKDGYLVCSFSDGERTTMASAADVAAGAADLLAALDDLRRFGYGECAWLDPEGEYRWMLRREGSQTTVAVMWSHGTATGYQHVFRGECDFEWLEARLRAELERIDIAPHPG